MDDARGATSPISYALTIAISMILVTGLVVAATGHVSDQRERTAEAQMDVVAQHVAGSLEAADRLVRADEDGDPRSVRLERDLPDRIVGSGYSVKITDAEATPPSTVTVSSPVTNRNVSVSYHTDTDVTGSTVRDGTIVVVYDDSGSDELEVQNG